MNITTYRPSIYANARRAEAEDRVEASIASADGGFVTAASAPAATSTGSPRLGFSSGADLSAGAVSGSGSPALALRMAAGAGASGW